MVYKILKNRAAVNILKLLYDNEVVHRKSYSMALGDIKASLGVLFPNQAVDILARNNLIVADETDSGMALSITEKGKQFITVLDQLIFLMRAKEIQGNNIALTYELTDMEEKILLVLYKLQKEIGDIVPLKNLTQEIHHYKKQKPLSKPISRLEELGLICKMKKGRLIFLGITDSGERVINTQLVSEKIA